jgi:hypothetical protein
MEDTDEKLAKLEERIRVIEVRASASGRKSPCST